MQLQESKLRPLESCLKHQADLGRMWEDHKEKGIQYMDTKIAMLSAALKVVALQSCVRKNTGLS